MIKRILIFGGGLILLMLITLTILVFVTPGEFKTKREITINQPKAEVWNYVKFIKNQNEWRPWVKKDPQIKQTFRGSDGEVGLVSAWESNHEIKS
jgi:hypothetical protein